MESLSCPTLKAVFSRNIRQKWKPTKLQQLGTRYIFILQKFFRALPYHRKINHWKLGVKKLVAGKLFLDFFTPPSLRCCYRLQKCGIHFVSLINDVNMLSRNFDEETRWGVVSRQNEMNSKNPHVWPKNVWTEMCFNGFPEMTQKFVSRTIERFLRTGGVSDKV